MARYIAMLLLTWAGWAYCQSGGDASAAPAAASAPTLMAGNAAAHSAAPSTALPLAMALALEDAQGSVGFSEPCVADEVDKRELPYRGTLILVRSVRCSNAAGPHEFMQVLYRGTLLVVDADKVLATEKSLAQARSVDNAQVDASMAAWTDASHYVAAQDFKRASGILKATAPQGVAILESSITKTSEYTEGTDFSVTVFNSSAKSIKYVTITLVGLNAVMDPVSDRLHRGTAVTLRGIGPIEPQESAKYSKEYMWMTDLVEHFRITGIKLEYMDGMSRVVKDVKKALISRDDAAFLAAMAKAVD